MLRLVFAVAFGLSSAQAAMGQTDRWVALDDHGGTALVCDARLEEGGLCLLASCFNGTPVWGVIYGRPEALVAPQTLSVTVDGRLSYRLASTELFEPSARSYAAPLYGGEGWRMIDAVSGGDRAVVSLTTEAGVLTRELTLRGSSGALATVTRACPNPDPEFDPSDVPVGRSTAAPTPPTSRRFSVPDAIDALFVGQGCVATEDEVFGLLSREFGGPSGARAPFRIWTEDPNWGSRYEVVSRDPITYRMISGACTGLDRAAAGPDTGYEGAVERRVQAIVGEACDGRDGIIRPDGVKRADMDGDGHLDLVVDEGYIECTGVPFQSINCGAQVCTFHIDLWRDGRLEAQLTALNAVGDLVPGAPPGLELYSHGGAQVVIGWDGTGFSQR